MIRSVDSRADVHSSPESSTLPIKRTEKDHLSSLREAGSSSWAGFGEFVLDILSVVWDWCKYNLLFCCFDDGEEKRVKLVSTLEVFMDKVYSPHGENDAAVFHEEYSKLPDEIRIGVEEQLIKELEKAFPEKVDELCPDRSVEKFLSSPYESLSEMNGGPTAADLEELQAPEHELWVLVALQNYAREQRAYETM